MRVILFRGKRLDNGQFVIGDYFREMDVANGKLHHQILKYIGYGYWDKHEVDPDTIGQYTGLQDKNGVKIFEGDIVEAWSEGACAKGEVKQRFDGTWIFYPAWQQEQFWRVWPSETVEVIGNIYDNPELLGK